MTARPLCVLLDGVLLGEVHRDTAGRLELRYDEDYASDPFAVPLSVSMPVSRRVHPDRAVAPWLWGLLPDNEDVRRRWCREYGVVGDSPFGLLSTPVGHDCAGAVQFCRTDEINWLTDRGGDVAWLSESQAAVHLRRLHEDATAWHDADRLLRFSLAGGQAKTALYRHGDHWGIPTGNAPTTHILKPTIKGLPNTHINEHLCLSAARALGLGAAPSELVRFEDQSAVAVRRYDRAREDNVVYRLHQEDICQALSLYPTARYETDGGPTSSDVVAALRRYGRAGGVGADVSRFVAAQAFNWLIAAPDGHAKNFSLLHSGPFPSLAPLYDVTSGLPYINPGRDPFQLAMSVGGGFRVNSVATSHWRRAATAMQVDPDETLDMISDLAERVPAAFAAAAENPVVQAVDSDFASRMVDRVTTHSQACLGVLGVPSPAPPPHQRPGHSFD